MRLSKKENYQKLLDKHEENIQDIWKVVNLIRKTTDAKENTN